MKRFPLKSITRIKKHNLQLEVKSILLNNSWFVFSDTGEKIIFMFRSNSELLIDINGKVSKGGWILIPHNDLFIDMGTEFYLYNIALVENQLLILNLKESNDYLILIEDGFMNQLALNSIDRIDNYLENIYIIEAELEQRRIEKIRQETIRLEEEKKIQQQKTNEQERIKKEKKFKIVALTFCLISFVLNIIYSLIISLIISHIALVININPISSFISIVVLFVPLPEFCAAFIAYYINDVDKINNEFNMFLLMYIINIAIRYSIGIYIGFLVLS